MYMSNNKATFDKKRCKKEVTKVRLPNEATWKYREALKAQLIILG